MFVFMRQGGIVIFKLKQASRNQSQGDRIRPEVECEHQFH